MVQIGCLTHLSGMWAPDDTPCAWPDCSSGTPNDRYLRQSGSATTLLHRVRLDSHSGEPRYFWRADGSDWMSIAMDVRFREHALSQVGAPHKTGFLYHYTTVAAFKQIIESQELWLSDYAYLNDSSEIQHGLALAEGIAGSLLSSVSATSRALLSDLLTISIEERPRTCVACFSYERDSLTQWKGYGERTFGVAFGVDSDVLERAVGATARFVPVVYDNAVKRDLLASLIHDWATLLDRDLAERDADREKYALLIRLNFFELLATLKDESFADEREVRMIYQEHARAFSSLGYDLAPKRFRTVGSLIMPFTSTRDLAALRHAEHSILPQSGISITDVVVGPHPLKNLAVSGIREFLIAHGYEVDVEPSRVPFR